MFSVLPQPLPHPIPLDVVHEIINQLHDDISALQSCSLVCRAWLPMCRRYILADIPCSGHRLPKFCDLLKKPSSSFSRYTRRLFIYGIYISAPTSCPQLQITSLFLYNIDAKHIPTNLSLIFSAVTNLELDQIWGLTLADLAQICCSFPCLQTFSFNGVLRRCEAYEISEANLDLPTNLQSINVCCKDLTTFLRWLLSRKNIPQLTTLRVYNVERSDIEEFIRHLQEIGDSVEHLEFGLAYFQQLMKDGIFQLHHYRQISLTHTPQLRSLNLVESELLLQLLKSGTLPTHLERVTVAIAVKGLYAVDNTEWAELDRVIMNPQATFHLRSLTVVVDIISQSRPAQIMPEPLKLTEVEAVIRDKMPLCNARGIVHVVPDTKTEGSKKGSLIRRLSWTERFLV